MVDLGGLLGGFAKGYLYAGFITSFIVAAFSWNKQRKGPGWSLFIIVVFALGWPYWMLRHKK